MMKKTKILYALIIYLFGGSLLGLTLRSLIEAESIAAYSIGLLVVQLMILIPVYFINQEDIHQMFDDFKKHYQKYLKDTVWFLERFHHLVQARKIL